MATPSPTQSQKASPLSPDPSKCISPPSSHTPHPERSPKLPDPPKQTKDTRRVYRIRKSENSATHKATEKAQLKQVDVEFPAPNPDLKHPQTPVSGRGTQQTGLGLKATPHAGYFSRFGFTEDMRRTHRIEHRNKLMRDQMVANFRMLGEEHRPQQLGATGITQQSKTVRSHRSETGQIPTGLLGAVGTNPHRVPISPDQYDEWISAQELLRTRETAAPREHDPITKDWQETYRLANIRKKPQFGGLSRDNWTQREYMRQVHGIDVAEHDKERDRKSDVDISRRTDPPPRPEYYQRQQMYLRSHYGLLMKRTLQKSLSHKKENKAPQAYIYKSNDLFSGRLTSKAPPTLKPNKSFYLGSTSLTT